MRSNRLDMLYRATILEHSKNPANKRTLEDYSNEMELYNPSCGDQVSVQFKLENNHITDIGFGGNGCVISMASADIMAELMKDKTLEEANHLIETFSSMIKGESDVDTKILKEAEYLEGVSKFPTRVRCATLSWHALEKGLEKEKIVEQEEGEHD